MKPYISWSEYYLWSTDINQYFNDYILGLKSKPSEAMRYGSIIHDAIAGEIKDVEHVLKKEYYDSRQIRVALDLIKRTPKPPYAEIGIYVAGSRANGLKGDLIVKLDGYDPSTMTIEEWKTTKNGWRTQQDVDDHGQLTVYSLAHHCITGIIPNLRLTRLDTGNGKVKAYETIRTPQQLREMVEKLNVMYDDLMQKGWWTMRKSSNWSDQYVNQCKEDTKLFVSIAPKYEVQSVLRES